MTAKDAINMLIGHLQYKVDHCKSAEYNVRLQDAINALLRLYHQNEDANLESRKKDKEIQEEKQRISIILRLVCADQKLAQIPTWYLLPFADVPIEKVNLNDVIFGYDQVTAILRQMDFLGQQYSQTKSQDVRNMIRDMFRSCVEDLHNLWPFDGELSLMIQEIEIRYNI